MTTITTARTARPATNPLVELYNEKLSTMSREQIRAELAALEEMQRRDAEQRTHFAQLSQTELRAELSRLEALVWNAKRVQMDRIKADIAAERAAPPVEPLDATAAGPDECYIGEIDGEPVRLRYSYDINAAPQWEPVEVVVDWGGLTIAADRQTVGFRAGERVELEEIPLTVWGQLREAAGAEVVERLVVLARRLIRP